MWYGVGFAQTRRYNRKEHPRGQEQLGSASLFLEIDVLCPIPIPHILSFFIFGFPCESGAAMREMRLLQYSDTLPSIPDPEYRAAQKTLASSHNRRGRRLTHAY